MAFRDQREAQRARIDALEDEVAQLKQERDRLRSGGGSGDETEGDELDAAESDAIDDELLQEATAERAKELTLATRAAEAKRREEQRRKATHGPLDRWAVAWNLRASLHVFLLVTAGIGLLGVLGFGNALVNSPLMLENERATMRVFVLVFALCALGGSACLAHSLLQLRKLRSKLPFELESKGWASLVDQEHFAHKEMWWHVVFTVEGGQKAEVSEALDRFCERANATFYGADDPTSDERVRWARKSARKARGSANRHTANAILWFCAEDLAAIASGKRRVKRVTLRVSTRFVHVSAPSN